MTRIYAAICAIALFGLTSNGCSWFEKHPVIPAVVTCSGETIPLALVTQVYSDVMSDNWIDLTLNVVPLLKDGYSDIECIFGYLKVSNPETAPHIQKLKAQHADDFKGSVSLRSPGDWSGGPPERAPWIGVDRPVIPIDGMIPALAECDRRCGVPMTGLATAEGCKCWHAKLKTSHGVGAWVAAR